MSISNDERAHHLFYGRVAHVLGTSATRDQSQQVVEKTRFLKRRLPVAISRSVTVLFIARISEVN
jgi:hypothetical protein